MRWADRRRALRNRLLSSKGFRRLAAAFPLTRPIARRQAGELFDLVAGFVYSQVLLACVQLRLLERLSGQPQSSTTLAAVCDVPVDRMERLLRAAQSLQLLEQFSDGRYGLGKLGAPLIGNTAVRALIEHHRLLYADLADPVALLRGQRGSGELARYWPYAGEGPADHLAPDQIAPYTALMAASQPLVAEEILAAYRFDQHKRLLDVGGGDGSFLIEVARRHPRLELTLFDLPAVADKARQRLTAAGLAGRSGAIGGNFLVDRLPRGADLVTLVRVIHDHDDEQACRILVAARECLPAHGRLLLAEPMAGTPGAQAMGDAYFGLYLLAMGSGRPRSPEQLQALLHRSGFGNVQTLPTRIPLQTGLMVASGFTSSFVHIA